MVEKILKKDSGLEFNYCLFKPKNIEANEKYPLIIFLHGAGELGEADGARV